MSICILTQDVFTTTVLLEYILSFYLIKGFRSVATLATIRATQMC